MTQNPTDQTSPTSNQDGDEPEQIEIYGVLVPREPHFEFEVIKPGSPEHEILVDTRHDMVTSADVGYAVFANLVKNRNLVSEDGEAPKHIAVMKVDKCDEFMLAMNFELLKLLTHGARKEILKHQMLRIPYGHFTERAKKLIVQYGKPIVERAGQLVLGQIVNSAILAEDGIVIPVPEMWDFPRNLTMEEYCELLYDMGGGIGSVPTPIKLTINNEATGGNAQIGIKIETNPNLTPEQRKQLRDMLDKLKDENGLTRIDNMDETSKADGHMLDAATKSTVQNAEAALQATGDSLKNQGFMAGGALQLIEALDRPFLLQWRQYVRRMHNRFAGDDDEELTNRRFSRRSPVTPLPRGKRTKFYWGRRPPERPIALVVVDTSGSMGVNEIASVRGQLIELLNLGAMVLIMQVDAGVASEPVVFTKKDDLNEWWGRGGTDFRPAFDYVAEHMGGSQTMPSYIIYFTDGYGTAPDEEFPIPTLWVLTSEGYTPEQFAANVCSWGECTVLKTGSRDAA